MIGRSLRWRLLLGAAAAILVALAIAGVFMTLLFERHLQRQMAVEMQRDGLLLVGGVTPAADGTLQLARELADARLDAPAGGYYWQVSAANGGAQRSRSLWDQALAEPPALRGDRWSQQRGAGPFGVEVMTIARRIRSGDDGPEFVVQLAQDTAPLRAARAAFARELALFLAMLWVVLSTAAWLQVALGLRPLGRVRGELAALRDNAGRRLPDAGLREIQPLTEAINALADAREGDLERARRRAADLAHGLKTPLSALAAQSRRAREAGASEAADGMDRAIAAIAATVDAELARARIASAGAAATSLPTPLRACIERLVTVLEHTERGGELAFAIDVEETLAVPVPAEALAELLGAVLDNAVRHARKQVRVSARRDGDGLRLSIDDDGPGIADDRRREALIRGRRLDETGGTGLGLAIAGELAAATGGRIDLDVSPLGGLRVDFRWPP